MPQNQCFQAFSPLPSLPKTQRKHLNRLFSKQLSMMLHFFPVQFAKFLDFSAFPAISHLITDDPVSYCLFVKYSERLQKLSNESLSTFKSSKMKDQESFDHLWAIQIKSTTLLLEQDGSKPDNNHTYRYAPVSRGKPSSHGSTVYGTIPHTLIIHICSSSYVIMPQSLQKVTTVEHGVQRCPRQTTISTFTESV